MTGLWSVEGPNVDVGYANLRLAVYPQEQEIRETLDTMWEEFEPYADADFVPGFARDPDARFWEMYVGYCLLQDNRELLTAAQRQVGQGLPDLCVSDGCRRIWIEAIAPSPGDPGPDRVVGPVPINDGGGAALMPVRQAQLRMTSALHTKSRVLQGYINNGTIGADDVRLVAINAGRFGLYVQERPLPLILSSVFPIGEEFVSIDLETNEIVGQGFHQSLHIERQGGAIPRTAFIDPESPFKHVSGIIWSRASIGNYDREARPLSLVHNPLADVSMPQGWGAWDREFVTAPQGTGWNTTDIAE